MDRIRCIPLLSQVTKTLTLFLVTLTLLAGTGAQAAKIKQLRTVEGITEYSLPNGLQLLLFPDNSKDTITVNITYRVGSKHENYGETGMAHLLEHLLFKGSKKHPDITKEITNHGAQANGTTWLERTNYYETFKASEENLAWALSMEADRMVNSFVSKDDLESEMTVVRNEFERGENLPWRTLLQRVYATALDWHNYGNSTIGARSDIENVKIENLQAFYKKYYQPDNATLIIAGKFDPKQALKEVNKTFGKIKKPKRELPEFYTAEPVQDGERQVNLRRTGGEQVLGAAYRIPSGAHQDFAALSVLGSIIGSSPAGRLHKNLIENQLATTTWAWPNQQKEASLIYFNVVADLTTDIDKTKAVLLDTLESFAANPVTEKEVERAKRTILKDIELAFNDTQTISIELSEWIGIGDWRLLFIERDRIEAISVADVQRAAEHYLIRSNRTLGQFIPTDKPHRADIPKAPDIAKLVDGYVGKKQVAAGEIFDATLENVAAREIRSAKDGIKIATVPIKTRGESVFLEMRLGLGNKESLQNKGAVMEMTTNMLLRGTQNYSREQLQDKFDMIKANGGISSDSQGVYIFYETTRENLPKVIDLVHEVLTTANFPEKEFDLLKSQRLSQMTSDNTDPQALAFSTFNEKLNTYPRGHMHAASTIPQAIEDMKEVTLKDVKSFYKSHFGADNMQVGIAGDIDHEAISLQIFEKFSGWDNKTPYQRETIAFQDAEKVLESIDTPDKKNSVFIAGTNLDITHQHPDAPALYVATRILGGGTLNSRLANRIRQQDGLSYGVGAMVRMDRVHANARWMAYAISAPQNTEKVQQAFFEEMQRARKEGFTQEEVSEAIDGLLDSAKVARSNNKNLAQSLRDLYHDDISIQQEIDLQNKLRALSLEQVNAAMKKYLAPEQMTIIKAGDFSNIGG